MAVQYLLFCLVLQGWFQLSATECPSSQYTFPRSANLSTEDYKFFWKVDGENITCRIEVRTTGWVGLGLSPNGDMPGSDVVTGWLIDGQAHFQDRFATERARPTVDVHQDWTLLESGEDGQHTCLTFTRSLRNCDTEDFDVEFDDVWVIYAWHENDPPPGEDIMKHTHKGKLMLNLMQETTETPLPPDAVPYFFGIANYSVPDDDTTYVSILNKLPETLTQRTHHIVKIEHEVYVENVDLVHHLRLARCARSVLPEWDGKYWFSHKNYTIEIDGELVTPACFQNVFVWTVGGKPFILPGNLSMPFGGANDSLVMMVEIHYNNPSRRSDWRDSSGLKVWVVPTPRPVQADLLYAGMSTSANTEVLPPGQKRFYHFGFCARECLQPAMESNDLSEIYIYAVCQHAHLAARTMRTRHFRNGQELPPILSEPNYNFDFQQTRILSTPVRVLPGDEFVLECGLDSSNRTHATVGGPSVLDEMCETFLYYYPRMPNLVTCLGNPQVTEIVETIGYNNYSNGECYDPSTSQWRPWREVVADPATWTSERAAALQEVMRSHSPLVFCGSSPEMATAILVERKTFELPDTQEGFCGEDPDGSASPTATDNAWRLQFKDWVLLSAVMSLTIYL